LQVYWFGPLVGAALGALFYEGTFAVNSSLSKARAYLLDGAYEPDKLRVEVTAVPQSDVDREEIKDEVSVTTTKSSSKFSVKNEKLTVTEREFSL
jgi:hypothetical protein